MNDEIIYVCQVPMCFAQGGEYHIEEHSYYYCDEHALAWGWCAQCEKYVGRKNIHAYGMCADCLETPGQSLEINAAIDAILDEMEQCPYCESTDVILQKHGGFCHACEQGWDDGG